MCDIPNQIKRIFYYIVFIILKTFYIDVNLNLKKLKKKNFSQESIVLFIYKKKT